MTEENKIESIVFGWPSIEKAAEEIYSGIHRQLLEGSPVFLYRSMSDKSDLVQVVVVQNLKKYFREGEIERSYNTLIPNDYGVGLIYKGFTTYLPHVPMEYLELDLRGDLVKCKVEKDIVGVYNQILKRLRKENGNTENTSH